MPEDVAQEEEDATPLANSEKVYNLHSLTYEELCNELRLSSRQAQDFIDFRQKTAPEQFTLPRLKEIPSWDRRTIDRIAPKLVAEPIFSSRDSFANRIHRNIRREVALSLTYPWLDNQQELSSSGTPLSFTLRGRYQSAAYDVALATRKRSFTPYFRSGSPIPGQWAFYASLEQPLRSIKRLVLGDYSVDCGLGLVSRYAFMSGPLINSVQDANNPARIRGLSSLAGVKHFRGVATEIGADRWQAIVAYSTDKFYGEKEEIEHSFIPIWNPQETHDLESIREHTYLGRLAYRDNIWEIGVNALYSHWGGWILNRPLPGYAGNDLATSINRIGNFSINSAYTTPKGNIIIATELAMDLHRKPASVFAITYRHDNGSRLHLSGRYLSDRYIAPYGTSLGHYRAPGNEYGLFFRMQSRLSSRCEFDVYNDVYKSILPRYRKSIPALGTEGGATLSFYPTEKIVLMGGGNYRYMRDSHRQGRWLLSSRININSRCLLLSKIQCKRYAKIGDSTVQQGWLISTQTNFNINPSIAFRMFLAYFYSDGFQTRHYLQMPRIRFHFSSQMRYGEGIAGAVMLSARIKSWQLQGAISCTQNIVRADSHQPSSPRNIALSLGAFCRI